jgi:hypothetical protein
MWMLKQGQGIVPIVVKILQFFPSKLPQYQDHCVSIMVLINVLLGRALPIYVRVQYVTLTPCVKNIGELTPTAPNPQLTWVGMLRV